MNQPPFKCIRHQYDTPTFKTNALRSDSNEGRLKRLLLQYKRLLQSCLAITGDVYPVLHDTPTFKTRALRLASIEGWVKRLLLLY